MRQLTHYSPVVCDENEKGAAGAPFIKTVLKTTCSRLAVILQDFMND